jgi:hypothetical protein
MHIHASPFMQMQEFRKRKNEVPSKTWILLPVVMWNDNPPFPGLGLQI